METLLRSSGYIKRSLVLVSLGVATLATGCGPNSGGVSSMLNSIQVKTFEQNGELWSQMSAQIDTGGMILASVNLPVVDPKNPDRVYGQLTLQSNLCPGTGVCAGGGTLTIAVNISAVSHVPLVDTTLPNGTMIPVGGVAQSAIVGLPIGSTGAKLYVGFGQGVALLGVAIPFQALDKVGQYVPGVNIFQPFSIDQVNGLVGMFTGNTTKTTGIGLFVDLSNLLNNSPVPAPTSVAAAEVSSMRAALSSVASADIEVAQSAQPIHFQEVKPSSWKEQAVYYKLWQLSSKKTRLHMH